MQTTLMAGTLTSRGPQHHSGGMCTEATTLFASQEHGILVHDIQVLEPANVSSLLDDLDQKNIL